MAFREKTAIVIVRFVVTVSFMVAAGDHVVKDIAGSEEDSWKSILAEERYEVYFVHKGLGFNDLFADLFAYHIADAAREKKYYPAIESG